MSSSHRRLGLCASALSDFVDEASGTKHLITESHLRSLMKLLKGVGIKTVSWGYYADADGGHLVLRNGQRKLVEVVIPKYTGKDAQNSWEKFRRKHLVVVPEEIDPRTGKPSKSCRIRKSVIYDAYCRWCEKEGLELVTARTMGTLSKDIQRKYDHTGRVVLCNVKPKSVK